MRRFLLLAHRVPADGAFSLNDLAGGAGRMDEVARAVSTAFTLSNDLRRDTEMTVLFRAEAPGAARRVDLVGARLRHLNPDERSTAALLKNALVRAAHYPGEFESSPGLRVGPVDPMTALAEFARGPGAFWLTESGRPLEEQAAASPEGFRAIVSDPFDPTEAEVALLRDAGVPTASVSPRTLRTSQVIDLVHAAWDRRESSGPGPTVNAPGAGRPASAPS